MGFGDTVRGAASIIGNSLALIDGYFKDTFSDGLFAGLTKMADDVTHLGSVFPSFSNAFGAFGKEIGDVKPLLSDLQDAFSAFEGHGWGAMFDNLGHAAGDLGTLISDGVQAGIDAIVDLGGKLASWTLNVGVPTVTGWLTDHAGDMWSALESAAGFVGTVLGSLTSWTLDVAAPHITGWLEDAASFTAQITTWARDGLNGVNWSQLMTRSMQASFSSGEWVSSASKNIVSSLVSGLSDASVSWDGVGDAIGFGIGKSIQTLVAGGVAFVEITNSFIGGIVSSMTSGDVSWSGVGDALLAGITKAVTGLHDATTALFVGLWDGLTDGIHDQVANALNDVISMIDGMHIPGVSFKLLVTPQLLASDLVSSITNAAQKASAGLVNAMTGSTSNNTGANGSGAGGGGGQGAAGGGGAGWLLPQDVQTNSQDLDRAAQSRTVTTTFVANDLTSPIAHAVDAAVRAVQTVHSTIMQQMGGEAVTGVAGVVHAALNAIPTAWHTAITQAGAEAVSAASVVAHAAIAAIPTHWLTSIVQAGAEAVTSAAYAARSAILSVPTYHETTFAAYDAGVEAVASSVAAAINAIPSVKTVTVNTVSSGVALPYATGGTVMSTLARLGDGGGPELVVKPDGGMFVAMTDAIYPTPPGSHVYTASQTASMIGDLQPVPAYASGSGRPVLALPQNDGPRISMNVAIIDPAKIQEFFEVAESAKVFGNVDELYAILGGR